MTWSPFLPLPFTPILREETLDFPDEYKTEVKGVMEAMRVLTAENLQKQIAPKLME